MLENKKFFIKTHGCQMNVYDSDKLTDVLKVNLKMVETNDPQDADLLLLNTCSIREKAQEKVFHQLGRWKKIKDNKPDILIAVGGCVASQEGKSIKSRAPSVDIIFGPQTIHRIPKMIKELSLLDVKTAVDVSFPEIEKFDYLPPQIKKHLQLIFLLWKVVVNIVLFVLYHIQEAKNSIEDLMILLMKQKILSAGSKRNCIAWTEC